MGFLKTLKEKVFKQDLENYENAGMIFMVRLLFEERCRMPMPDDMDEIMNKHLGNTKMLSYSDEMTGFMAKNYKVHYEDDDDLPVQLLIMKCVEIDKPIMDGLEISQLWDCPNAEEILKSCKYQVVANDMLASGLDHKVRAEMLVNFIEALVEMYPTCKAVVIENSKKMFTREDIINCNKPMEQKFIHYAVNVRSFNVDGTDDKIVDTIGMSTLYLPDLQYHFTGVDTKDVVNHAYNLLSYIYDDKNPIESGNTVDGLKQGLINIDVQWEVQYEESLVQPIREVLDVNMGNYAAGNRQ